MGHLNCVALTLCGRIVPHLALILGRVGGQIFLMGCFYARRPQLYGQWRVLSRVNFIVELRYILGYGVGTPTSIARDLYNKTNLAWRRNYVSRRYFNTSRVNANGVNMPGDPQDVARDHNF